jgi:hypothetical protein
LAKRISSFDATACSGNHAPPTTFIKGVAMKSVREIDAALRSMLDPDLPSRPLSCEGSPIGCGLVSVGINPATTTPFWKSWSPIAGCDRRQYLSDYVEQEGRFGPTRRRLEILHAQLKPFRMLELNIYPYSSPRLSMLPKELRDPSVFRMLLECSSPKLIFVHGAKAAKELAKVLQLPPLRRDQYTRVSFRGATVDVYYSNHLSYQWSDADVAALAREFRARLERSRSNK